MVWGILNAHWLLLAHWRKRLPALKLVRSPDDVQLLSPFRSEASVLQGAHELPFMCCRQDFGRYLHLLPAEGQQELTEAVEHSITRHDWDMTERGLHAVQSIAAHPEGGALLQVGHQILTSAH